MCSFRGSGDQQRIAMDQLQSSIVWVANAGDHYRGRDCDGKTFAGLGSAPGEFQFNAMVVPPSLANGDRGYDRYVWRIGYAAGYAYHGAEVRALSEAVH